MSVQALFNQERPSPTDFDKFLPWACTQLAVEASVVITRTVLSDYVSVVASERVKLKSKSNKIKPPSLVESDNDVEMDDKSLSNFIMGVKHDTLINIEAIYDSANCLIHIKFRKNKTIPRCIMKIIALVVQFHPSLSIITINKGLQMAAMYEMAKFLPSSRITEIYLDHTFLIEANYHVLLDNSNLKLLSISKCKINDVVVKTIATKLVHPSPAAQSLFILNLATNRITDVGVKYIADALRSNRQLSYLNLADNMITDKGANLILESLSEFPLTASELMGKRSRHMIYLKDRAEFILKTVKELKAGEFDKRVARRRSIKPLPPVGVKKKPTEKDTLGTDQSKSLPVLDMLYYERAELVADSILGTFNDPFSPANTVTKDGIVYCLGNNSLSYINFAYNNLTYFTIKKLLAVIISQKLLCRKPKGLVNVVVEGNCIPSQCYELQQIDDLLESGFATVHRRMSIYSKKRASHSKASPR